MLSQTLFNTPFYWLFSVTILLAIIQSFSPDRWIPFSLIAWKNNYQRSQIFQSIFNLAGFHVMSSLVLYAILTRPIFWWSSDINRSKYLLIAIFTLATAIFIFRLYNYRRASRMMILPAESKYAKNLLFYMMGPSEVLLFLFLQFEVAGYGFLVPTIAYFCGTFLSLFSWNYIATRAWDQPQIFSQVKHALRLRGMFFSTFLMLVTLYWLVV